MSGAWQFVCYLTPTGDRIIAYGCPLSLFRACRPVYRYRWPEVA